MPRAEGTSHLFIHSTSETVEHRTPSVVEFFDAEASVTGGGGGVGLGWMDEGFPC